MDTPRTRFTLIPVLLALVVGALSRPATNVVKVTARGMGFEHEQPWRRTSLLAAPVSLARVGLSWLRGCLDRRHTVFGQGLAAAVIVIAAVFLSPAALIAAPVVFGAITETQHAGAFLLSETHGGLGRSAVTVLSGQNLVAGAVCGRVKYGIGRVSIPTVVGTGNGTASLVFAGPEVEVGNYVLTCTATATHGGVWSLTTPGGKALPTFTMTPGAGGTTAYTSRHINFSITDGSTDFAAGDVFTFVVSTTVPTVIGGTGTGVLSALSLGPDAKPGNYKINNDVVVANGGDMTVIGPDGTNVGGRFIWSASGSTASFTSRQINFTISDATDYIANNHFNVAVFNQLNGGKVVAWDPTTFDGRHQVAGILYDDVDASSADKAGVLVDGYAVILKSALTWGGSITSSQKESAYLDMLKLGMRAR